MVKITIEKNDAGQRLDRFLRKYFREAPLAAIYRIIRKSLKVNGKRAGENTRLQEGDELSLFISPEQAEEWRGKGTVRTSPRQFTVIYEDEHVLIVSKPSGLLTHGDGREKSRTLANQVLGYLQEKGEFDPAKEQTFRPSPANRLDRNTSGLVMFGKSAQAMRQLTESLRERDAIRKFYRTIAAGAFSEEQIITGDLVKDEAENRVREVSGVDGAKAAATRAYPIRTGEDFSLVEVELLTGRTHQIRVHMAGIGHPLAGDPKYGDPKINEIARRHGITTQLLHACRLEFGEMDGALEGLCGKTVEAPAPKAFVRGERELIHVGKQR